MDHHRLRRKGAKLFLAAAAGLALGLGPAVTCHGVSCIEGTHLFDVNRGQAAFRQPSDISVSGDRLFVLDDLNGQIAVFGLDGSYASTVSLPGGNGGSYLGFDVGGDDNFYLAASGAGKIVVLSGKGKVLRDFAVDENEKGSEPVSVDVSRGQCLVLDNEKHRVRIFDLEGKLQEEWGGLGDDTGSFRYPFRIVQDGAGRVIVTDALNSRIQAFTPRGEPLFVFGDFGVTEGTLYRPAGIAPWSEDLMVVSDNFLGSIQFFDMKGRYRGVLCDGSGQPLLLDNPVSLAVAGSKLFILEMGAGRVRAFRVQP